MHSPQPCACTASSGTTADQSCGVGSVPHLASQPANYSYYPLYIVHCASTQVLQVAPYYKRHPRSHPGWPQQYQRVPTTNQSGAQVQIANGGWFVGRRRVIGRSVCIDHHTHPADRLQNRKGVRPKHQASIMVRAARPLSPTCARSRGASSEPAMAISRARRAAEATARARAGRSSSCSPLSRASLLERLCSHSASPST